MIPDVERCEKIAVSLLLSQDIQNLTLDAQTLEHEKNIHEVSFAQYCAETGMPRHCFGEEKSFLTKEKGVWIILYNKRLSKRQINWSIAHELGHIYLEHPDDSPVMEKEANIFTSFLFLSDCVLRAICERNRNVSATRLAYQFNQSIDCIKVRMQALNCKSYTISKEKEEALLRRYEPFLSGAIMH